MLMYGVWLLLPAIAEKQLCQTVGDSHIALGPWSLKYLLSGPIQNKFLNFWLEWSWYSQLSEKSYFVRSYPAIP